SNAATKITVNGSLPAAALNAAAYNAVTGLLQVTGAGLTAGIALGDLTLGNGAGVYTLNPASDKLTAVSATGFSVQLGAGGLSAANALFAAANGDNGGAYVLNAGTGWDGAYTPAAGASVSASHDTISASGASAPTVNDFAAAKPLAGVQIRDSASEALTAAIAYSAGDGTLSGAGLTGTAGDYTLSAPSAAAMQAALRQLVYTPDIALSGSAASYNENITVTLSAASSALDNTALAPLAANVTVHVPGAPAVTSAGYDAASGVLTVAGDNLAPGVALADISLFAGTDGYALTGAGDSVGNFSANGFSVTLGGADKAGANALFGLYGAGDSAGSYTLSTAANWDGAGSQAGSGAPLLASGDNSITVSGLTPVSGAGVSDPFANISLSDANPVQSDSVTISFASGAGTLSGGGLSAGTVAGGRISYSLAAAAPANLQAELQNLAFTPAAGPSGTANFSLNFTGVTVTAAAHPSLTLSNGLDNPVAVAVNGGGEIFAANNGALGALDSGSLTAYSASGRMLFDVGAGVSLPSSLAVDAAGNVYVANYNVDNYGDGTVAEYSAGGALLRTFTGLTDVQSVIVDGQGDVFAACLGGNVNGGPISAGGYIAEFSASGVLQQVITNGIDNPASLAVDGGGDVYAANVSNNSVTEYSAAGALLQTFSGVVSNPLSVAVDGQGDVYVGGGGGVEEFSAAGALLYTDANNFTDPAALAVDGNGNVYVADQNFAGSTVSEFSNGGALLATLSAGLNNPAGLAVDSAGNVYAVNSLTGTLEKFGQAANGAYMTDHYSYVEPNSGLSSLTVIGNAAPGYNLEIADAAGFNARQISSAMVSAAGGDPTQLAGWVSGALSSAAGAGDLAQHQIGWFEFGGNTYLVEQANAAGTAYGGGDTLIELVGVHNETGAVFNAAMHVLTL
ncbi:MAG: hypothetical protein ABSB19_13765, partial [Methylomonas sp.]